MAFYTTLINVYISIIHNKFDIDKILIFLSITKVLSHTHYLFTSINKQFLLTIFLNRVSNKHIPFFMKLMDQLNYSKINCPKPLKSNSGSYLIKLKNKTACIVSFLVGKDKNKLNLKNCF